MNLLTAIGRIFYFEGFYSESEAAVKLTLTIPSGEFRQDEDGKKCTLTVKKLFLSVKFNVVFYLH